MDLIKRIFKYTDREDPVIKNKMLLWSKTILDEGKYQMIDNGIGDYDNLFKPGLFGGSSYVDVSLS